jgi:formate/nitrite transporter FocA (FNT family)
MDIHEHERQTVLDRKELNARQVHDALRLEGEEEIQRSSAGLFWSALACGLTLGLSLLAQAILKSRLPDAWWAPLLTSAGYAVGFIALELGRQELYTGNTLTAILPALDQRRADMLPNVFRVWAVVFIGNLLGALLFAWGASWTTAFSQPLKDASIALGVEHVGYPFWTAFVKGIFGGWLIALMVWLMPGANHARIWVAGIIAWCLAAAQFTHVIAGSVDILFAVLSGRVSALTYIGGYLVPVFAGNTLGSLVFVGALNHAQVAVEH